jgi:hypothetical protein
MGHFKTLKKIMGCEKKDQSVCDGPYPKFNSFDCGDKLKNFGSYNGTASSLLSLDCERWAMPGQPFELEECAHYAARNFAMATALAGDANFRFDVRPLLVATTTAAFNDSDGKGRIISPDLPLKSFLSQYSKVRGTHCANAKETLEKNMMLSAMDRTAYHWPVDFKMFNASAEMDDVIMKKTIEMCQDIADANENLSLTGWQLICLFATIAGKLKAKGQTDISGASVAQFLEGINMASKSELKSLLTETGQRGLGDSLRAYERYQTAGVGGMFVSARLKFGRNCLLDGVTKLLRISSHVGGAKLTESIPPLAFVCEWLYVRMSRGILDYDTSAAYLSKSVLPLAIQAFRLAAYALSTFQFGSVENGNMSVDDEVLSVFKSPLGWDVGTALIPLDKRKEKIMVMQTPAKNMFTLLDAIFTGEHDPILKESEANLSKRPTDKDVFFYPKFRMQELVPP